MCVQTVHGTVCVGGGGRDYERDVGGIPSLEGQCSPERLFNNIFVEQEKMQRSAFYKGTYYIKNDQLIIIFEVGAYLQWWANLDQASKHLEVFRFRDLSPTPIP